MKTRKIKIRHGMLVSFAVLILLMILALWLVQTVFLDDFYYAVKQNDLKRVSKEITELLGDDPSETLRDHESGRELGELCLKNEMSYVTMLSGTVIGNSYMQDDTLFSLLLSNRLNEEIARSERDLSEAIIPVTEGPDPQNAKTSALLLIKSVDTGDSGVLTYVLCTNIYPTSSMTRTISTQLVAISVLALILAVAVSLFVSQKIASPITKLSAESKKLAKGNYDLDYPKACGLSEVDELVDSLKHSALELEKTEKLQKDLVANISHDLRTPLTLIQGYAELMRDIPPENNEKNLDVIVSEVKRLNTLVSDVLDLSKLQSGTAEFRDEQFDLVQITEEVLSSYRDLCEGDGYIFDLSKPEGEVVVFADKKKIASVIHNLISNAVKYTGEDKKVKVVVETAGSKTRLSVHDTGKGIPEDKLKDIWQRYYKLDSSESHTRGAVGTGLGLAIVKTVLDHYGADCGVRSGEYGSVFWFILDLKKDN